MGLKHSIPSSEGFSEIFSSPDKKFSTNSLLVLCKENQLEHSRVGVAIKKKDIRLAVNRNRIKRKIKGSFMNNISTIPALDIIVMVGPGKKTENKKNLFGLWQEVKKNNNA